MKPNSEIYDISKELAAEFGEVGSPEREKAIEQAWEEYIVESHTLQNRRRNGVESSE